jgi:hypothetical protein
METKSQAVAIIQRAESEIRELLLRVAGEGDYEHAALLAAWAQRLRQITELPSAAKSTTGFDGHTRISTDSPPASSSPSANGASERRKVTRLSKSKTNKANYPKFLRDREELVKIGWSKKQKAEYRHKAPKAVVLLVAQALQKKGAGSEHFTFEELLPFRDRGAGADVPSYQAYMVLAWLRQENLIVQHGRQGYSLPLNINLMDALEERWKLLPKA